MAQEQLFLVVDLPRGHRGTVQVDGNGLAGEQSGVDDLVFDIDGWLGERLTQPDGRGLVGADHGC